MIKSLASNRFVYIVLLLAGAIQFYRRLKNMKVFNGMVNMKQGEQFFFLQFILYLFVLCSELY